MVSYFSSLSVPLPSFFLIRRTMTSTEIPTPFFFPPPLPPRFSPFFPFSRKPSLVGLSPFLYSWSLNFPPPPIRRPPPNEMPPPLPFRYFFIPPLPRRRRERHSIRRRKSFLDPSLFPSYHLASKNFLAYLSERPFPPSIPSFKLPPSSFSLLKVGNYPSFFHLKTESSFASGPPSLSPFSRRE